MYDPMNVDQDEADIPSTVSTGYVSVTEVMSTYVVFISHRPSIHKKTNYCRPKSYKKIARKSTNSLPAGLGGFKNSISR